MDNLQYQIMDRFKELGVESFKPYYKWITFNTMLKEYEWIWNFQNGFKPCYKWITFNTLNIKGFILFTDVVLNLVING